MNELFQIEESKSPRLAWMERHGIETIDSGRNFRPGDECPETGAQLYRWMATTGRFCIGGYLDVNSAWGDTEDDAIAALAVKLGIRLWFEEV